VKDSGTDEKAQTSIMNTDRLHSNPANLPSLQPELSAAAHLVFLEDYMPLPDGEQVDKNNTTRRLGQRRRIQPSTSTKTLQFPPTNRRSPKRQSSGAVRGLFSGPRKEERAFMERVKSREAAKHSAREVTEPEIVSDASYLLIVNYPLDRSETTSNLDQKMEESVPIYERRMPAQRLFRRRQDYCVPTL